MRALQIGFALFMAWIGLVPKSQATTIFTISGANATSCAGPYAVGNTSTCNQAYAITGEVGTSVSLATIEAIGTGVYDISNDLTSLSLTDGANTVTLADLFTSGTSTAAMCPTAPSSPYCFDLFVKGGQITGWQFVGFDGSGLAFNPSENAYDGSTVGLGTTFGGNFGDVNGTAIYTGCTAVGGPGTTCSGSTIPAEWATSAFSNLTITSTPEPGTLYLLGAGLLGVVTFRRSTGRKFLS
jgi:hypothetical protein